MGKISDLISSELVQAETSGSSLDGPISLLAMIDPVSGASGSKGHHFVDTAYGSKIDVAQATAQKKQAQEAWLAMLSCKLSKQQRKTVLSLFSDRVVPWFTKIELLMDFLTTSFDSGGSTSLLAFSSIFHLIQEKNLDYPQFYYKLYSLLNSDVLHSKHRARFFRLLATFLASTHLPAALVASFMKRLSRLSLFAPPSGVVIVIPFIYNLLKNHPTCTFMIHRKKEYSDYWTEEGMDDPFNCEEPDPMKTFAIESSLWELHALQSHYQPNVATVAKIISEQFTKHSYNLEDFIDHSHSTVCSYSVCRDKG